MIFIPEIFANIWQYRRINISCIRRACKWCYIIKNEVRDAAVLQGTWCNSHIMMDTTIHENGLWTLTTPWESMSLIIIAHHGSCHGNLFVVCGRLLQKFRTWGDNLSQKLGQFVKVMIHHQFLVKVVTGRRQVTVSTTFLPAPRHWTQKMNAPTTVNTGCIP